METVILDKFVNGGQALGQLADGRKVFVWGGLPGESVNIRLTRNKTAYAEAIVEEVLSPSKDRVAPVDDSYKATSPWQILDFDRENEWKGKIVEELFAHEKIKISKQVVITDGKQYQYRNKMEYSVFGDDKGIHLALHERGSHRKIIVSGSSLARKKLDEGAQAVLSAMPKPTRAGDLKTIIVRANQKDDVVAALFVKTKSFPSLSLPAGLKGLRVYYSTPKSPASVATKHLYDIGDVRLTDTVLGTKLAYDVDSFFQVNVPVFELALQSIKETVGDSDSVIDMYAGVGSIGLSIGATEAKLIESNPSSAEMARFNAGLHNQQVEIIEASTEKSLEHISSSAPIIFDPPRAGLHKDVIHRLLEVTPPKIVYLSCNPVTQARDIAAVSEKYELASLETYNFFPRTPHIETLATLTLKL